MPPHLLVPSDPCRNIHAMTRRCSQCNEEKLLDGFYLEKGRPRANCKDCHKKKIYARRDADREAFRAYQREWNAKNPGKHAEYEARRRARRGDEINARRREARAADPERYRKVQRRHASENREQINERRRERYERRRGYILQQKREYEQSNPDRVRSWSRGDPEKKREYMRQYYQDNREYWERSRAKRRAQLAEVEHEPYTRREIYDRDGGLCQGCGVELPFEPNGFQIDHIVPISRGGPDTPANVQLMCPACNREKWARLDWKPSITLTS